MQFLLNIAEKGYAPDKAVRFGIRQLLKMRIREIEEDKKAQRDFVQELKEMPIAINTDEANEQHYELPPEFFEMALGKNLKYSSSLYDLGAKNLDQAEEDMLNLYLDRAQIEDGMDILELGCGWGSLTVWMAKKFPNSQITAVSNSAPQRKFIESRMKAQGCENFNVITKDMNDFSIDKKFDRIVSIEMFEHMRNYNQLFPKVSSWLKDDGLLFLHIFCHKDSTYFFETEGDHNWMGKYFFTGGIMPGFDLFENVQESLQLRKKWKVNGTNYGRTSNDWVTNMDTNKKEILSLFEKTYGKENATIWFYRWRIFFSSCAELFNYKEGNEWFVGHYLFGK
jgi:cyclopropane-fatty-acyl-phospholipid synthase